jgi:hypothetical protein
MERDPGYGIGSLRAAKPKKNRSTGNRRALAPGVGAEKRGCLALEK